MILNLLQIKWNIQKSFSDFTFESASLSILFLRRYYEFSPFSDTERSDLPIRNSSRASQNYQWLSLVSKFIVISSKLLTILIFWKQRRRFDKGTIQ